MTKANAWGTTAANKPLAPMTIDRREPGPHDVVIEVLYCGVCHSDIHQARDEWGGALFPMVPGHEVLGRVTFVGDHVKKLAVGDIAGIGCMVDSCRDCDSCKRDVEMFCEKGVSWTYNGTLQDRSTRTYGGYSSSIVVDERFALRVPKEMDLAAAAPLLCAGITTYSPLRQWNCKPGDRVGVVGLGGLGHMGVKLAVSMGAEVTLFSTSRAKEADAKRMGAHDFVATSDPGVFDKHARRFDLLIDTVSAQHDFNAYLKLLRPLGVMALVGAPPEPTPVAAFSLLGGNKRLVGSQIGGIKETQEMLDYCAAKKIVADVEVIPVEKINDAYERMLKNDVRYRFVLDTTSLR